MANNYFANPILICRVPEVIFETNEVWKDIDEDELLEIRKLVMHFMVSTAVQRFTHALFEVHFICRHCTLKPSHE